MWRPQVDRWRRQLGHWLWPSGCVLCGQAGQPGLDLCMGCQDDLPVNEPACGRCAGPLPPGVTDGDCAPCLLRPPPFAHCLAPLRYEFPADRLIQQLKYQRQLPPGRVLGAVLAAHLRHADAQRPQLILPVPLGPARYRSRGFNQARELALPVGEALGIPVRSDVLVRQRETLEQAGLDRNERLRNVRGAFALRGSLNVRHVAVVDDVITTASTMTAIAQLLRATGVQRVDVWAVARAVRR